MSGARRGQSAFWRLVERRGGQRPAGEDEGGLEKATKTAVDIAREASRVAQAHYDAWLVELVGPELAGLPPGRVEELIAGGFLNPAATTLRFFGGLDPWGVVVGMGQAIAEAGPRAAEMRRWTLEEWGKALPPAEPPAEPPGGGPGWRGGDPARAGSALIPSPPEGLPAAVREAWIQARTRGGEYARGLGNIVTDALEDEVVEAWEEAEVVAEGDREQRLGTREAIREATAEAVARGWTADRLASELGNRTQDWARNWRRIAATELQGAHNDAVAISTVRLDGPEGRIARVPESTACEACRAMFLRADGRPRVFTVEELVANGANVGKKREEWKPTLWPLHPHCLCSTQRVPRGFDFNARWELVPAREG